MGRGRAEDNTMVEATRHISVDKNSDLGRLLDEAGRAGEPVVLEVNGRSFRLMPEAPTNENPWKDYDPEKVLAALENTAGSWADLDTDKLIADIYKAREKGSRPADRP